MLFFFRGHGEADEFRVQMVILCVYDIAQRVRRTVKTAQGFSQDG